MLQLILTQSHRDPNDNEAAVDARFTHGEVLDPHGRPYQPDQLVSPGANIWFYRTPGPERPVPFDIPVLYQDENILIADKPPFLSTMPRGRHITETATVRLRRTTGNPDLSPVHRLDRLTAGVLMFTTRPEVRGAYQELFAQRKVTKIYEAIAPYDPAITPDTIWKHRIEKVRGAVQATIVDGPPNSLTRVLSVEPLPGGAYARYTLKPETGRTHQLRLHMNNAGVPIVGDPFYPELLPLMEEDFSNYMRLLACELSFWDPVTHQHRTFRTHQRHTL